MTYLLYFLDVSKKVIRPKEMKKPYPLDPIIAKVVEVVESHTGRSIDTGHKIEMVVLRHLLNKKAVSIHGLDLLEGPYFWYSNKGNEIDFVVKLGNFLVPVEDEESLWSRCCHNEKQHIQRRENIRHPGVDFCECN